MKNLGVNNFEVFINSFYLTDLYRFLELAIIVLIDSYFRPKGRS